MMSTWTGYLAWCKSLAPPRNRAAGDGAGPQAGYTLIETLVAFVILAMSTAGFYQAWSISAQGLIRAELKSDALFVSDSVLERVGTNELPLRLGVYTAQPDALPFWRVEIGPYNANTTSRLQLMRVVVTVFPDASDQRELARIQSLRLGIRLQ